MLEGNLTQIQPEQQRDVPAIIHQLGSKDAAESVEAEREIRQLGIEALEPLITVLSQYEKVYARRRRINLLLIPLFFSLWMTIVSQLKKDDFIGLFFLVLPALAIIIWIALSLNRWTKPSPSHLKAMQLLQEIEDVRAVGPLIDTLQLGHEEHTDEETRRRTLSLLTRLLPQLKQSDADLIQDRHRDHFHYVLKHVEHFEIGPSYGIDYITAILKALEQIGDVRSLPYVERIANLGAAPTVVHAGVNRVRRGYNAAFTFLTAAGVSNGTKRSVDRDQIMAAAKECLPYLQARMEQDQISRSLLRGSAPPTEAQEALLRSSANTAVAPEELLRADIRTDGTT